VISHDVESLAIRECTETNDHDGMIELINRAATSTRWVDDLTAIIELDDQVKDTLESTVESFDDAVALRAVGGREDLLEHETASFIHHHRR
jgi:hypothetical protein